MSYLLMVCYAKYMFVFSSIENAAALDGCRREHLLLDSQIWVMSNALCPGMALCSRSTQPSTRLIRIRPSATAFKIRQTYTVLTLHITQFRALLIPVGCLSITLRKTAHAVFII